jgi:hypothetical protein
MYWVGSVAKGDAICTYDSTAKTCSPAELPAGSELYWPVIGDVDYSRDWLAAAWPVYW